MKYFLLVVGIAAMVVVVGIVVILFLRSQSGRELVGFRDWVKNPEYKQEAADYRAAREAVEVPDDISLQEIQQLVDRLYVQADDDFNFHRLELVGEKAVPLLVQALEDPKTASIEFGEGEHVFDALSPFERIVDLLQPFGPTDAVLPLAKYLEHENKHFRTQAAIALGNIGSTECIGPVTKALNDEDDYVRSYAMIGIEYAMNADRCSKEFLNGIFPALTKLLDRDDSSVSGTAPELLLAIDTERALPILMSPQYFSVENEEVHYIIRAMNAANHKIPHDKLLPFLAATKPLIDTYPHDYDYAEALIAYAKNPDASAEETFRSELHSPEENIQEAAAEGLAILSGVTRAREVVFDALDNRGFDKLAPTQQHYYAVYNYNAEVNNGGHSQYFVNSSGDNWNSAHVGLLAIGATKRANILKEATALFGAAGPSTDNDQRHRQIADFSDRQDKTLNDLDKAYYACDENIEALLAQYALQHKQDFTAP